jgi:hypothetical protein
MYIQVGKTDILWMPWGIVSGKEVAEHQFSIQPLLAPLTDGHFCVSSSSCTHTTLIIFSWMRSKQFAHKIFALCKTLSLTLSQILSSFF